MGLMSVRPPTVRARVASAAVTAAAAAGVGIAMALVAGFVVFAVEGVPVSLISGTATAWVVSDAPARLPWLTGVLLVAVLVAMWLASCRLGRGTPGDAVFAIEVRTVDGGPVPRWRHGARTIVPVALFGAGVAAGRPGVGLVLVALGWSVAFLRRDRRTGFDLLAGVVPSSTEPIGIDAAAAAATWAEIDAKRRAGDPPRD